jgi:hypothetical protein
MKFDYMEMNISSAKRKNEIIIFAVAMILSRV